MTDPSLARNHRSINSNRSGAKWKAEVARKEKEEELKQPKVKKKDPEKCKELADIAEDVGTIRHRCEDTLTNECQDEVRFDADKETMEQLTKTQ